METPFVFVELTLTVHPHATEKDAVREGLKIALNEGRVVRLLFPGGASRVIHPDNVVNTLVVQSAG